ncbi:MAG: helix-hairpin-helix domain-containing protein [Rhodocyclaceae bacterium]|nr:helix-hairpin-helix domain-containing protein [Rhodocyclaceae bacterium]
MLKNLRALFLALMVAVVPVGAMAAKKAEAVQAEAAAQTAVVDINTATEAELATLTNIGEAKAREIVAYRKANGPFASVEDLAKVKGIGAATIEKNRARLTVSAAQGKKK